MSFSKSRKQNSPLNKLKNISIGKKALIYVFSMSAIGAIVGTVDSKIVMQKCLSAENCAIENRAMMQLGKISMGTCAGMVAATLLSIPALINEEH